MKYEFCLEDYWNTMKTINRRKKVRDYGFRQIKIDGKEDCELYAYGYRIVIPELDMTVREGMEYYICSNGDFEPTDSFVIIYSGDEKDPLKYKESYCNANLISIVGMTARNKNLNTNPKCYIDDSEFEFDH